ncbi:MAG: MCE family protein [Planctomycetes bacterium]|nr:MCE family protein [Planctomycetota bacterium]
MTVELPVAEVTTAPRRRWLMLMLPVLAVLVCAVLAWRGWRARGPVLEIRFSEGYGLKAGDTLRYRDLAVGEVVDVRLAESMDSVLALVRLRHDATQMARTGSRFWVVKPEISLAGVRGLDTMIGSRYLAIAPGTGDRQLYFEGLDASPVLAGLEPGGLELVLEATTSGGLRAGAPVSYRQLPVGRVVGVALASDAATVEVRIYIEPTYSSLVRKGTMFWNASGIDLSGGVFSGLTIEVDSLQSILSGGISFATPDDPGPEVATGRRFILHRRVKDDWTEWHPSLMVGDGLMPDGTILPRPLRARLVWTGDRMWSDTDPRAGWLIPVPGGLLAPADLVEPPDSARAGTARLEWDGVSHPLAELRIEPLGPLMLIGARPPGHRLPQVRALRAPEDCVLISQAGIAPHPLAAGKLRSMKEGGWLVAGAGLDGRWHGAAVVARSDGALVGVLLVDAQVRVASVSDAQSTPAGTAQDAKPDEQSADAK